MRYLSLFFLFIMVGCNTATSTTAIQADPNWFHGQLDNGMKYHFYPTPDDEVSVRLVLHVGSFQETEQQQGYAHFVEHMAFNGSEHFSGNDVVKLFERSGGSFGADINAYTSYQMTSYKLDLANEAELLPALNWMRDIADGLNFDPNQVENEKGVILGELRRSRPENKPLNFRAYDAAIEGTPFEKHDPIGSAASVESATAKSLQAFHQQWYQPQFAELVISGNIDNAALKEMVERQFGDWASDPQVTVTKQRAININVKDVTLPIGEMESPSLHYNVLRDNISVTTREQQHQAWLDDVTQQLIQQRFYTIFNDAAESYSYLYVQSNYLNYNRVSSGGVIFAPEKRQRIEGLFVETLASLRDHGVVQSELDAIIASYTSASINLESDWKKRKPVAIADEQVFVLEQDAVFQSKEDYSTSLSHFIEKTDLTSVNQNLKNLLSDNVTWMQGVDKSESFELVEARIPEIKTMYKAEGTKPLAMNKQNKNLALPSEMGSIVSRREHAGGFVVWNLSNGVEVWFQQDENVGNRAHVVYASQGGKAALNSDLYPAIELSVETAIRSGLGELSGADLDSYLRKNDTAFFPFIGFTHHGVEFTTPKDNLAESFNVLFNITTDINVDQRQLDAVRDEFYQNRSAYLSSPNGKWIKATNQNAYLDGSRHRLVMTGDVASVTPEQIHELHSELFGKNRGYKMVIIADLEAEQITPLLRQYVASIPLGEAEPTDYSIQYDLAAKPRINVEEATEPTSTFLMRVINDTGLAKSGADIFAEDMLQRISTARVITHLREEQGLDYSPAVYPVTQDSERVSDWFFEAQVAPGDVNKLEASVNDVIDELASSITKEERDTAAKQLTVALTPLDNDPAQRAWFYTRYLIHGYGVDVLADVDATAQSVRLNDIKHLAKLAFGEGSRRSVSTLTPKPSE